MANGNFDVMCPVNNTKAAVMPTDEESKIHPSSIYGITKQNQEQMVLTVCSLPANPRGGFPVSECVWARPILIESVYRDTFHLFYINKKREGHQYF